MRPVRVPCGRVPRRSYRPARCKQQTGEQDVDVLRSWLSSSGSLYPALHRLEQRGWLKSTWAISEANQRAKYYELTATGKAQLAREQDGWSQLVTATSRMMQPATAGQEWWCNLTSALSTTKSAAIWR